MQIKYHKIFLKHYRQRIDPHKNLVARFRQRLEIRIGDPKSAVLGDHQLVGKLQQYRSFSVTGDIRVIYRVDGDELLLYDIGSHSQVY